jgi:phospholipid transport system transporter-binding protein
MLILPDRLTTEQASSTQRMLSQTLKLAAKSGPLPKPVVVDASNLVHFDSCALAVLLSCQRQTESLGSRLVLRQPPNKLMTLAQLYGIHTLLNVVS